MTRQKSFKSRVRARMDKTGERYAAARRQLIDQAEQPSPRPSAPPATQPAEAVQGMRFSDASLRERTGRGWDEWFALLDAWDATAHTHTEIARWLVEEHGVNGWWAQSVTVGYERARGLRVPGQHADGFSVSASKTIATRVDQLFAAFADETIRERWLPGATLSVRTATAPKSFRADWEDGSSRIVAGFTAKGEDKAQVAVQHEKLPDAETASQRKAYWRERLVALKELLED